MQSLIQRDALCRRYPRRSRAIELGLVLSLCLCAYAIACLAGLGIA